MAEKLFSRAWLAPLVGALVLVVHPRPILADGSPGAAPPTPGLGAESIPAEPPSTHYDQLSKPTKPVAATSSEALQTTADRRSPAERGVEAKTAEVTPSPLVPQPLTWYGVTLYGVIDVGVAYLSHGAPPSSTYGPGLPYVVQSYSNRPTTSVAGNGLSQSKIGLSGIEPLRLLDLKAVFKLEAGFQPTSGRLTDGPRSLIDNNGLANGDKVTAGDSARAGQPFQGAAFAGISSALLGTLTFGRQSSLMADDLMKYDPQLQSQAFSPIGYSGISGGLGATEDKILDNSLKYGVAYGPLHLAIMYQYSSQGFLRGAESADLGLDWAGLSVDLLWGRVHGAISASSLSAAQNATAPGTLAATVSDNTAYAAMARYAIRSVKLYAGYEHMIYANPEDPLPNGSTTLGGYVLSDVNNTAYTIHKVLQYAWFGVRLSATRSLEVSGAYYLFRQRSYNANACFDNSSGSCSGAYHDASLVVDYKLAPRFDVYTGVNYSRAVDGMAAGFLNQDDWTSMTGVRFVF